MKVSIKKFDVEMEIRNNGVEFDIYDNKDAHLGDAIITKTGIIWCDGKTHRKNGKKIKWSDFIEWANKK